ncbi:GAF domain-containing protein [Natronospirillum operosum]|uniref:histidine kinase n=1 Tax=Natronospirillum operosum TaxID=2759953 RepID=A0A4Z0WFJ6_9GAMM|nr:ATP-binding protein [Natronospirillum operosum]TGG93318.1 GAF domain-containing protein [Natronospirillum operosum]
MKAPAEPFDEVLRQRELDLLGIVDTPAEERFDRITRLAQRLFDVDIALVSLIDHDRQWWKSRQGMFDTQAPRMTSFCGHAILSSEVMEVSDALQDPRFHDNPQVTGPPHVRFYAGAPLHMLSGRRAGTLCVAHSEPRQLTEAQRADLRALADLVEEALYARDRDLLKRQAEERERLLNALFELSPIGIALIDVDTRQLLEANAALAEQQQEGMGALLKQTYEELLPVSQRGLELVRFARLATPGWHPPFESEFERRDGTTYPVQIYAAMMMARNGRRNIWMLVEDISSRREAERLKSEFLATVSHELRTPLTAIAGTLGLLRGGAVGALPVPVLPLVEAAWENSQRLQYLINDLLDLERLEAGRMHLQSSVQPLLPLLEEACRSNESYAHQLDVTLKALDLDQSPAAMALVNVDAHRLQQVLGNLLSNAAKFSPPGGEVRLWVDHSEPGWIRVSVQDQGPGITPGFRDRLFDKFTQADSSDRRRHGGTGLGLAISRQLMMLMDGYVGFESELGAGSTFWIELPLQGHQAASGE